MTKEEKIKEAWGKLKLIPIYKNDYCRENGWSSFSPDFKKQKHYNEKLLDFIGIKCCRPKTLQGIEDNNGWIKIQSEEDLPKDFNRSEFKLYYWTNNGLYESEDYKRHKLHYNNLEITHYRLEPIFNPEPPIY